MDGIISGAGARIEWGGACLRAQLLPLRLHVSCILEGAYGFYYAGGGSVKLPWDYPRIVHAGPITREMCIEQFTATPAVGTSLARWNAA